jgi:transposase
VLDNGAGHKAKAVRWPSNVVPVFLPPYSPELNPIERLWRDLKDRLADVPTKTAALQSLTSFAYFVHAVETAQKALYV